MMTLRISIDNREEYENLYIDSVKIDTGKTFIEMGPSVEAKNISLSGPDFPKVYTKEETEVCDSNESPILLGEPIGPKELTLYIRPEEIDIADFNKDIFFVYILVGGSENSKDNIGAMTVVANLRKIYDQSMAYIKELERTCKIPTGFIDRILRLKAFELSIKTGNFTEGINQWDRLIKDNLGANKINSGTYCNC